MINISSICAEFDDNIRLYFMINFHNIFIYIKKIDSIEFSFFFLKNQNIFMK